MGMRSRAPLVLAAVAIAVGVPVGAAKPIPPITPPWQNCKQFNAKYPHGVGKANAHDRVKGAAKPVTTFRRSTRIYNTAISHNPQLDRDGDGVVCEKR